MGEICVIYDQGCYFSFQCLCLAPTYELALQIGEVTREMSKHMQGLEVTMAVRGERGEWHYNRMKCFHLKYKTKHVNRIY